MTGKGFQSFARSSSMSFTPQETMKSSQNFDNIRDNSSLNMDHPHFKLFKNGMKVTLGNNPVKFGRKVFIASNTPQCTHSKIPIPGNSNPLGLDMTEEH